MQSLRIDDIDIHIIRFSSFSGNEKQFLKYLNYEEMNRYERFHFDKDKHQYIICRGMLRTLLGEKIGISPEKISLNFNPYGKPLLCENQQKQSFHFNVSHSGDLGLIAISDKSEIGIDVEKHKKIDDMDSIMNHQFSPVEVDLYTKASDKQQFFFDLWTQKEAIVKASGKGLSLSLGNWSINPDENQYSIEVDAASFQVRKLTIDNDYSAALALRLNIL